jgi:outer membrane murein-binding lipoprotein Lpp
LVYKNILDLHKHFKPQNQNPMKRNIILFSAVIGGALFFQGCQNCDEAVNKAKEAANAECNTQLEGLNTQIADLNTQLTTVTLERDSLLSVIDVLTAPKGSKPAAKKTATTTPAKEEPKQGVKSMSDQQSGGVKSMSDQQSGGLKQLKDKK